MRATFVDLRKRSAEIIRALRRKESVTVIYRGKPAAVMYPIDDSTDIPRASDHAAFGMWKERADQANVAEHVRALRRGRLDDL